MLQLTDITKVYETAGFKQTALDKLSVTFRDSEFAAILGPSGSGKTTLLNIVGGLDRADSGDLIIDGVSTKLYKDRDWDTYRNNRIGFVFQSYNLIAHQTVLSNVELALTLSGVSKAERQRRAKEALTEVGLADHLHKRPSQLSGGQMQRVAIARALVNNPRIVLADEPTGALDSTTSLQIMDLIGHIAKDRLVIMVTHNPDLARDYATRTVTLSDGRIVSDSNPIMPTVAEAAAAGVTAASAAGAEGDATGDGANSKKKAPKRASMSFLTSIALSFSNLMTKKGRTIMTAFAGSIGIIGIAAILALATGVNNYINNVEKETLSQYPLSINKSGIDLTSLLSSSGMGGNNSNNNSNSNNKSSNGSSTASAKKDTIQENNILSNVFKTINTNDLASLKTFLDDDSQSHIKRYVNAIEYTYDVTPQIYLGDTSKQVWQANPDMISSMMSGASSGLGASAGGSRASSAMSMGMNMSAFNPLPRDTSLVQDQYDVVAGAWPDSYDQCVLVLSPEGRTSDYIAYVLGLRDPAQLKQMLEDFSNQKSITVPASDQNFSYKQIMDVDLRLVEPGSYYTWDSTYKVYVDRQSDQAYMKGIVKTAQQLHICGIVKPKPGSNLTALRPGVCYSPKLIDYLMDKSAQSDIVKKQLAQPGIDVFTGKTFAEANKEGGLSGFDMSKMFSINKDSLNKALGSGLSGFDMSSLKGLGSVDLSGALDPDALMKNMPALPAMDMSKMLSGIKPSDLPLDDLSKFASGVLSDYLSARLPAGQQQAQQLLDGFTAYLQTPEAQATLAAALPQVIDTAGLNNLAATVLAEYINYCAANGITNANDIIAGFPAWISQPAVSAEITAQLGALVNTDALNTLVMKLIQDYLTSSGITIDGLTSGLATDFSTWLSDPAVMAKIQKDFTANVNLDPLMAKISQSLGAYLQQALTSFMKQFMTALQKQLSSAMANSKKQLTGLLGSGLNFDPNSLGKLFDFKLTQDQLAQLILSMMGTQQKSYDNNLKTLGYADPAHPASINIYPKNFESKQGVIDVLTGYNNRMKKTGQPKKVVVYTDIVGALMSSVTSIINMISYVLITFVSISLIVSSIMIGIVTYISVLERKKEIGILRSIGASKRNISNVFNAEALITGLAAGLLGVGITALICIPANLIVNHLLNVQNIAHLSLAPAAILVAISCFLSFVAGLIPAAAAARRDPVEALRSE
ncbi:MAG: ABC transporter ATP-binding protein/permease [Coriobacteriia bacterium]|nr:ABC transporter ATP-binding protein/permease [Coriobacteriia bacterium]